MKRYKDKKIAVIGLGVEGRDVVNFFNNKKIPITILDSKSEGELDLTGLSKDKIDLITGENYLSNLDKFDIVFRSPGVYRYKEELVEAQKKGVEISGAIKLFFDLFTGKIIGVTGTKGKGTTSTLVYEILKNAGKDVYLGGNIGKPVLELLDKLTSNSWVVLELSSFQLIDMTKSPHIAVVLNITLDHMDWHKNKREYTAAKANIVKHQNQEDFAVINFDYAKPKRFEKYGVSKKFYFSRKTKVKGVYVQTGVILNNSKGKQELIGDTKDLILRGEHNWENITAASTVASVVGINNKTISNTIFSFKGLEHRLEFVKTVNGISFYNDSFSTGPQPTIAAIRSFTEPMTLILGGFDKQLDYKEMAKVIAKSKNVKNIILIGDIREKVKTALNKANYNGIVVDMKYSKMDEIVKKAFLLSKKKSVVVLSPASSSFDMFESYKQRGNEFKKSVLKLS